MSITIDQSPIALAKKLAKIFPTYVIGYDNPNYTIKL